MKRFYAILCLMKKEEPAKPFMVRLSDDERRLFEKAAKIEGFHGVGPWMRTKLVALAKKILKKGAE